MDVLNRILETLKKQKKTQKELCDYIGISPNVSAEWKSGKSKSYKKHLPQIAEFLGVSVDRLLGNDVPKQDQDLTEYLEYLRTRPEMRMLFSLTKDATKEDVEKAVKVIEAMLKG